MRQGNDVEMSTLLIDREKRISNVGVVYNNVFYGPNWYLDGGKNNRNIALLTPHIALCKV